MSLFSDTAQALMAAGLFLAVIDLLIFGFATLFLTLFGLSLLTTGGLIYFSILDGSVSSTLIAVTLFTATYGVLLWKPLKRMQEQRKSNKVSSDLTGMSFTLQQDISPDSPGKYHYSGIDWTVKTTEVITQGTEVEVIDLQVGIMMVKTAQ